MVETEPTRTEVAPGPARKDTAPVHTAPGHSAAGSTADQRGLLLVGLFKLCKALFFISVGFGAFHMAHRNLGDVVMRFVDNLPIDPEGRVVSMLMDKADLINAHDLQRIGLGSILYAVMCVVEGTGLVLRKTWAEYFTVVLTALGLPIEAFEILRHFTWLKIGALVLNALILLYLLWILKRKRQAEAQAA